MFAIALPVSICAEEACAYVIWEVPNMHDIYIYIDGIYVRAHPQKTQKTPKSKVSWEIVRRTLDFGFLDRKSTFKRTKICKNIAKLKKST